MILETAQLVIQRKHSWADFFRAYLILVDDIELGRIRRNSTLTLEIPAGRHLIGARIDWARGEPILIEAAPGETVTIEVSNTYGARNSEYAITVGKDTYLTLKRVD